MRYVSILPICLLLAGCMTAATPVSHMSYSQLQEVARQVEQRCVDQGVARQSPQFEACVRQEATRETTLRQERRQMLMGGTVCNRVGNAVICD